MKRAFTLVELLICIAIVAIIAAITLGHRAAVDLVGGKPAIVKSTKKRVMVVALDTKTSPTTFICRIDNGSDAIPRYSEVRFSRDEIEPAIDVEQP